MLLIARYPFEWLNDIIFEGRTSETCLVLCPRLTFVCFAAVAQNMYLQYPHINFPTHSTPLPASETAPSPTLEMTCKLGPAAFTQKSYTGSMYLSLCCCVVGVFFAFMFGRVRLLRVLHVFARKNARGRYMRWGIYSHRYGNTCTAIPKRKGTVLQLGVGMVFFLT